MDELDAIEERQITGADNGEKETHRKAAFATEPERCEKQAT
jgi:hypothetical protein